MTAQPGHAEQAVVARLVAVVGNQNTVVAALPVDSNSWFNLCIVSHIYHQSRSKLP